MKNFKLIIFVFSILLALPYSSFAQKQLVKTVYKGAKGLFKREAKVLTKEGIEATNKSILKDAFKSGAEEIGKDYVRKASAKQLIRSAVRKNLLKEIEEKELARFYVMAWLVRKRKLLILRNRLLRKWQKRLLSTTTILKKYEHVQKRLEKKFPRHSLA